MEITLNSGKKVQIKEMKFLESSRLEKIKDIELVTKELMKLCLRPTNYNKLTKEEQEKIDKDLDEFTDDLSVKDGISLMEKIYELNGIKMPEDFTKSSV